MRGGQVSRPLRRPYHAAAVGAYAGDLRAFLRAFARGAAGACAAVLAEAGGGGRRGGTYVQREERVPAYQPRPREAVQAGSRRSAFA